MRRHTARAAASAAQRNPLRSRDFVLLLVATFTAVNNYATLLSVVPLWAAHGGSGGTGVGTTTGVVMGTTVLGQLNMGWLLRVLSLRWLLALGAAVMGLATPAYVLSDALLPILVVSGVRGIGFAMVVVAGSALTAELVPTAKLGKGVGMYGLATGLPSVVCLPVGVWVAQEVGFDWVFLATSALTLLAVPVVLAVAHRTDSERRPGRSDDSEPTSGRALRPLRDSWILMLVTAIGFGGASTFLPIALTHPATASAALLAMSIGVIAGRFGSGVLADTIGSGRMLLAAIVSSSAGMLGFVVVTATGAGGVVATLAAVAFGIGYGSSQSDTLLVMLRRAGPGRHGLVSTVWNIAVDGGAGIGAVLLGVVVALAGHTWSFAVAAAVICVTAPLAWLEGRRSPRPRVLDP